jgi:hypothetical protein
MPKFGDIYVVKAGDEFEGFTGKGQAKAYAKRTEGGTSTRVGQRRRGVTRCYLC